ncbi:MAG: hypothetical protein ACRCX2_07915 [Paraclostridium sp.]
MKKEILELFGTVKPGEVIEYDGILLEAVPSKTCKDCAFNPDECFPLGVWKKCATNPHKVNFRERRKGPDKDSWSAEDVANVAVCLSTNPTDPQTRIAGKCYIILTDFRRKKIRYVGEDGRAYSTDKKWVFKKITKKDHVVKELLEIANRRKSQLK